MAYKDYEGKIVVGYGVVLEGWTHSVFAAPSSLPKSMGPLQVLLNALHSGECYFRRLTGAELAARQADYSQKLKEGKIIPRKKRSDTGVQRQFYRKHDKTDDDDVDQEEGPSRKRARRDDSL